MTLHAFAWSVLHLGRTKGDCMKKIDIITRYEKLEDVKNAIGSAGANGMMVTSVMGHGNQRGYKEMYRGNEVQTNLLPKIRIEVIVPDDKVEDIVKSVITATRTDTVGDGKIFITDVLDAIRVRTGDRGDAAL